MVKQDFAGFIITYNRIEDLKNSIIKIKEQTIQPSLIVIADNSDDEDIIKDIKSLSGEGIEYHSMGGNFGPASAANYALQYLASRGFNWIYWGDDNNPPQYNDNFERLLNLPEKLQDKKIGALGAVGHKYDWRSGTICRIHVSSSEENPLEVDVIAGGMNLIISKEPVLSGILPDPDLFFGFEEYDYCLKLRESGYELFVDGLLMRKLREKYNRTDLKTRHKLIQRSPLTWRNYYTYRNTIYLMWFYYNKPLLAIKFSFIALLKGVSVFFNGFSSGVKGTKLMIKAIKDAFSKKMGRTIQPR